MKLITVGTTCVLLAMAMCGYSQQPANPNNPNQKPGVYTKNTMKRHTMRRTTIQGRSQRMGGNADLRTALSQLEAGQNTLHQAPNSTYRDAALKYVGIAIRDVQRAMGSHGRMRRRPTSGRPSRMIHKMSPTKTP